MGHFLLARTPDLQPVCATLPGKSAIRFVVAAALHFASIALGFLSGARSSSCDPGLFSLRLRLGSALPVLLHLGGFI